MTFAAIDTRTVPLGPCLTVTGMNEKSTGDPVRVVRGGVVIRRELFERLNRAGRVTEVSAPAGSGKSVLLRSWIDETALRSATAALTPVLDSSGPASHQVWLIAACLLEASARDALGDREAAGRALEQGLDLAEPDGLLFPFLLHPVPELLERHARQRTAHPALIRKIISVLGGGSWHQDPLPPPSSHSGHGMHALLIGTAITRKHGKF